jgi:pilus assembly protein CpaE
LQTNPAPLDSGENGRLKGLIFTRDEALAHTIERETRPLCNIEQVTESVREVMRVLAKGGIDTCFVHIPPGDRENGLALVQQVRRAHPGNGVFIVADEKDPDLILAGLRMGILDVLLPATNGNERFLPALRKAMGRSVSEGRNGFVYTLFSRKGGQGVTTLSVNLADQIQALTGSRVLLLDLNLYMGDVGAMVNINPDFTPFDLIRDLSRMDENLLLSSLCRHDRGFYVLPAPGTISDADRVHRNQVSDMLALLKRHFTHIVVDLSHDFSERTLAAAEASDRLVILVEPDLVSLKSAQQVLTFFQELNYGDERMAFVLNRASKRSILQPEDVQAVLKQPLLTSVADDWKTLTRAARKGEPLGVAHERRRITRDMHRLAVRLTGLAPAARRKGGLMSAFNWLGWFH